MNRLTTFVDQAPRDGLLRTKPSDRTGPLTRQVHTYNCPCLATSRLLLLRVGRETKAGYGIRPNLNSSTHECKVSKMSIALGALKSFVAEPTGQKQADDTVVLHVTHSNLSHHFNELRFDLHTTVESMKEKIRNHTGTPVDAQRLELYDNGDTKICDLSDDSKPLGFYSPIDGYRIHVVDLDPMSISSHGWLEDVSLVQKYHMSEEDYDKREDSFRKFKAKKLAADPTWTLEKEMAMRRGVQLPEVQILTEEHMADLATGIHVGDRCEVDPGAKRGVVRFVGKAESLAPGFWVGVQYDEPVGKHDGLVRGTRYFNCPQGFGAMLRPDKVKVGDFPERDPFEEEEPDEI